MSRPRGFVFYEGPSQLDGAPIVAILTGLASGSTNGKTGHMLQTWILRSDVDPITAVRTDADESICGDCKHRGAYGPLYRGALKNRRTCYVRLDTAPNGVYQGYRRGIYPRLQLGECRELIRSGAKIRGGSYGDPAAVPYWAWYALLDGMVPGTAYTHQWRRFPELASFCMASVDTPQERVEAKLLGFRTFRVRKYGDPVEAYETQCPASEEMGHKTNCVSCAACGGHRSKAKCDVTIVAHGAGAAAFAA